MYFKQLYLNCLAHASYIVGSNGEAAIVDPQRDVDLYLNEAKAQGLSIKYIFETHLHADFVSGHCELARLTGGQIVFGKAAEVNYAHVAAEDGQEFRVGDVSIRVLSTPGHTPESVCYLVTDTANAAEPVRLLTGDTLFIGDVGRPDLVGSKGFTSADMAGCMYDTLHTKLAALPDTTEVFPAHGAGSACGKNISKESSSTLGVQRASNYAMQPMTREAFVAMMTKDLPELPQHFPFDAQYNAEGPTPLADLAPPRALSVDDFEAMRADCTVVDVRPGAEFCAGNVPGSINVGLGGMFATWAGTVIPPRTKLLLVTANDAQVAEAAMRLARVGHDNVTGYLAGGFPSYATSGRAVRSFPQVSVARLNELVQSTPDLQVLDVRKIGEWNGGHVARAVHMPINKIATHTATPTFDRTKPVYLFCGSGYRSPIACALLDQMGYQNLIDVAGGWAAWAKEQLPAEVPQSSA